MYSDIAKYDKGYGVVPYYFIISYSALKVVYGYCFSNQNYGIQIKLNYLDLSVRFLNGTYSSWKVISAN